MRGEDVVLGRPLIGAVEAPINDLAAVPLGVVGDVTNGVGG